MLLTVPGLVLSTTVTAPWSLACAIVFVLLVVVIMVLDQTMAGGRFVTLGILPRNARGLVPNLVNAAITHFDWSHLSGNVPPLALLGALVACQVEAQTWLLVTGIIVLLGGLGTWLFGRRGVHSGASGVIYGYFGYLLAAAFFQPGMVGIGFLLFLGYGQMLRGLWPTKAPVSWEGHLSGFLAGALASLLLPWLVRVPWTPFQEGLRRLAGSASGAEIGVLTMVAFLVALLSLALGLALQEPEDLR